MVPILEVVSGHKAAAMIGISRVTLGRWVAAKKISWVLKLESGTELYDKATVERLATAYQAAQAAKAPRAA